MADNFHTTSFSHKPTNPVMMAEDNNKKDERKGKKRKRPPDELISDKGHTNTASQSSPIPSPVPTRNNFVILRQILPKPSHEEIPTTPIQDLIVRSPGKKLRSERKLPTVTSTKKEISWAALSPAKVASLNTEDDKRYLRQEWAERLVKMVWYCRFSEHIQGIISTNSHLRAYATAFLLRPYFGHNMEMSFEKKEFSNYVFKPGLLKPISVSVRNNKITELNDELARSLIGNKDVQFRRNLAILTLEKILTNLKADETVAGIYLGLFGRYFLAFYPNVLKTATDSMDQETATFQQPSYIPDNDENCITTNGMQFYYHESAANTSYEDPAVNQEVQSLTTTTQEDTVFFQNYNEPFLYASEEQVDPFSSESADPLWANLSEWSDTSLDEFN